MRIRFEKESFKLRTASYTLNLVKCIEISSFCVNFPQNSLRLLKSFVCKGRLGFKVGIEATYDAILVFQGH